MSTWIDDRRLFATSVVLAALICASVPESGESETPAGPIDTSAGESADGPVVPEATAAIHFSHGKHADVACETCHANGGEGPAGAAMPEMSVCADCHGPGAGESGTAEGPTPTLANCSGCHVGYEVTVDGPVDTPNDWQSVRPAPLVPPRPDARVSFDHAAHVDRLADAEGACATCHGSKGEPSMPTRSTCRTCHGNDGNANDGSGASGTLKPSNHTVAWERRHGAVARASSGRCEECHTESDCAECHTDTASEPFSVHPPNFDTLHAVDARAQSDDCADCHTVQTFCSQCHARTNHLADPPDRPPPRFDQHPPNWTTPNAPGNHAEMARRNITDCASCHTEDDCVTCHQGVNPHPPEFRFKCAQWLDANPAPCAKCHGNLSDLRTKCL